MKHHHINNDDYEIVNGRKVLKDGRVYRAKMTLMDSGHRVSHRPVFARVTDATGDPLGLHKPGWRVPAQDARDPLARHVVTDAARQAVLDARQHYLTRAYNGVAAWCGERGRRAGCFQGLKLRCDARQRYRDRISALCRRNFAGMKTPR
jgi:hypothetical protein